MTKYEVRGFDQQGNVVFHLAVEAPNEHVARLYTCAHLERTAYGAEAVRSAVWSEARERAH
jgi:hypothetical protein